MNFLPLDVGTKLAEDETATRRRGVGVQSAPLSKSLPKETRGEKDFPSLEGRGLKGG